MTRYEKGFIEKCAEYGVDSGTAISLMQKVATLTPKGAGKLLFNVFSKTDANGLAHYADRANRSMKFLDRLGKLTPDVKSNLEHITSLAKDVKAVAPEVSPGHVNYENLGERLRRYLTSHVHTSADHPSHTFDVTADEVPIGRIFQSLGFKRVAPAGTNPSPVLVRPS